MARKNESQTDEMTEWQNGWHQFPTNFTIHSDVLLLLKLRHVKGTKIKSLLSRTS